MAVLMCQRHLRDLERGHERGLRFDHEAAARALEFFPRVLRHSKGEWAGHPLELSPWQQFDIGCLFGWKRADGYRRFRGAYKTVARKNGKSTTAAGVGLYGLTADGEGGAEIYSYATKRDQARIVFGEAKNMVRRSGALSKRLSLSVANMAMLSTASKFEALAAEERSLDGLNPHIAIGDEVHAQRSRGLYDVMDTAMGARSQPIHYIITTRGADRHGICGELDDYSEKILKGELEDDSWFASIYCLDDDDAWDDEQAWAKANPNLGVSVKLDDLQRLALKARNAPGAQNEFRRKRCNLWTEAIERWLDYEAWKLCGGAWDEEECYGETAYAALDLSGSRDLTALILVIPHIDGRDRWVCRFWLPEKDLDEREIVDRVPYRQWAEMGLLRLTPGAAINRESIAREMMDLLEMFRLRGLAYDRWRMADVMAEMDRLGVRYQRIKTDQEAADVDPDEGLPLFDWGQGFRDMSPAIDELEAAVIDGRAAHGDHPIMTWCAANAVLGRDPAGNRKFLKDKATGRIDGVVAAAMAYGLKQRLDGVAGMAGTRVLTPDCITVW